MCEPEARRKVSSARSCRRAATRCFSSTFLRSTSRLSDCCSRRRVASSRTRRMACGISSPSYSSAARCRSSRGGRHSWTGGAGGGAGWWCTGTGTGTGWWWYRGPQRQTVLVSGFPDGAWRTMTASDLVTFVAENYTMRNRSPRLHAETLHVRHRNVRVQRADQISPSRCISPSRRWRVPMIGCMLAGLHLTADHAACAAHDADAASPG